MFEVRHARRRDAWLFVLGLGGFVGLLLAAGQGGPGAAWLRVAAPAWFAMASLVRLVLMAAGGERRDRSAADGQPAQASFSGKAQAGPAVSSWG